MSASTSSAESKVASAIMERQKKEAKDLRHLCTFPDTRKCRPCQEIPGLCKESEQNVYSDEKKCLDLCGKANVRERVQGAILDNTNFPLELGPLIAGYAEPMHIEEAQKEWNFTRFRSTDDKDKVAFLQRLQNFLLNEFTQELALATSEDEQERPLRLEQINQWLRRWNDAIQQMYNGEHKREMKEFDPGYRWFQADLPENLEEKRFTNEERKQMEIEERRALGLPDDPNSPISPVYSPTSPMSPTSPNPIESSSSSLSSSSSSSSSSFSLASFLSFSSSASSSSSSSSSSFSSPPFAQAWQTLWEEEEEGQEGEEKEEVKEGKEAKQPARKRARVSTRVKEQKEYRNLYMYWHFLLAWTIHTIGVYDAQQARPDLYTELVSEMKQYLRSPTQMSLRKRYDFQEDIACPFIGREWFSYLIETRRFDWLAWLESKEAIDGHEEHLPWNLIWNLDEKSQQEIVQAQNLQWGRSSPWPLTTGRTVLSDLSKKIADEQRNALSAWRANQTPQNWKRVQASLDRVGYSINHRSSFNMWNHVLSIILFKQMERRPFWQIDSKEEAIAFLQKLGRFRKQFLILGFKGYSLVLEWALTVLDKETVNRLCTIGQNAPPFTLGELRYYNELQETLEAFVGEFIRSGKTAAELKAIYNRYFKDMKFRAERFELWNLFRFCVSQPRTSQHFFNDEERPIYIELLQYYLSYPFHWAERARSDSFFSIFNV